MVNLLYYDFKANIQGKNISLLTCTALAVNVSIFPDASYTHSPNE